MKQPFNLSVAIIAKDEQRVIRNCFESVKSADEIVFVDTGSKDDTIKIASEYTNKIHQTEWEDDFSKVRNLACSLCKGDWILSIDADEQLENEGIAKIKQRVVLSDYAYRMLLEYPDKTVHGIKLFRNEAGIYWKGKAHNDLSIPVKVTIPIKIYCGNSPAHKNDPDRTFRILQDDIHKSLATTRNFYYLAREYANRHRFEDAIQWFVCYIKKGHDEFLRADACLYLAKIHRTLNDMQLARTWAGKATDILPEFREAWDYCAFIAQDKFKKLAYLEFYKTANNDGIRIIRKFRWSTLND